MTSPIALPAAGSAHGAPTTPVARPPGHDELVAAFLRGKAGTTLAAYRKALGDFARFAGKASVGEAARLLLADGPGPANLLAHRYRADLLERGLAPTTIGVRLSAVRSLVAFARLVGAVEWGLTVQGVKALPYRDVRGPGRAAVRRMIRESVESTTPKALRDHAVLRLLVDLALRRGEIVSLDVEHLDLTTGVVLVLGKGHRERVALTLPAPTAAALTAWLAVRGPDPGPLFVVFHRGGTPRRDADGALRRIAGADVFRLVRATSEAAGVGQVRPHALRHFAITAALDATGGDVRRVQAFSRHADVRVVLRYDDARGDAAGDVARLVAAQVGEPGTAAQGR